jgi:N-acetylmuramoyl-L-alanine amidase
MPTRSATSYSAPTPSTCAHPEPGNDLAAQRAGLGLERRRVYRGGMQDQCVCVQRRLPRRDVLKYAAAAPALLGMASLTTLTVAPNARAAPDVAGRIVFLDPGHNGANDASITRQVPTGRGGTKDCETSGTATDGGFPEHTFNWEVVLLIREALTQLGVRTAMSRGNDNALGPCVDQRAAMANGLNPDAVVSIHADGGPASGHGFHVNYSSPPLNAAQSGPAVQFAQVMRDQLVASGLQTSTYRGDAGLYGRSDLAGLNLAEFPSILVECGNMKNPDEAAQMESATGRANYATAVTRGIVQYLSQQPR